jgi:hypothetical protein
MHKIVNALLFQIGWFLCASSVLHDTEMLVLALCTSLIIVHLMKSQHKIQALSLVTVVLILGIIVDTSLHQLQIIDFYGWHIAYLSPFWDWMIWVMFALTLESSLAFLKKINWMAQAFTGLIFSPVSYIAGSKLGAAQFEPSLSHIAAVGLTWMLVLPCIFLLLQWINRKFE